MVLPTLSIPRPTYFEKKDASMTTSEDLLLWFLQRSCVHSGQGSHWSVSCFYAKRSCSKLHIAKNGLYICQMLQRISGVSGWIAGLRGDTSISRCLGDLCKVNRHSAKEEFFFWYHSIDMNCLLLHVKFEGGLSVSISRNRTQKLESKTNEFSKRHKFVSPSGCAGV
jgi:hypothetical protein